MPDCYKRCVMFQSEQTLKPLPFDPTVLMQDCRSLVKNFNCNNINHRDKQGGQISCIQGHSRTQECSKLQSQTQSQRVHTENITLSLKKEACNSVGLFIIGTISGVTATLGHFPSQPWWRTVERWVRLQENGPNLRSRIDCFVIC